jgi:hypothetical protein
MQKDQPTDPGIETGTEGQSKRSITDGGAGEGKEETEESDGGVEEMEGIVPEKRQSEAICAVIGNHETGA